MRKSIFITLLALSLLDNAFLNAQTGQLTISRVAQMPDLPSPYIMRDWKTVAIQYDAFIFSLNSTGQHLPLMQLKPAGINYPSLQPIALDSYVGSASHGNQAEAINILPALVGASLVGLDKANQSGTNWVLKAKDFFNSANGQNVYLNGYSSSSGGDWWYDLMPNVFFYQLYCQYPGTQDFDLQFTTVADRWLAAVLAMGGSTTPWTVPQMNHTAFNLSTMMPTNSGVTEAESAGTIAWLLYHAYQKTGSKKYLDGAQMALTFLSNLNFNPAYEIQLPYGSLVAAKMNAELGTRYKIEKMINWSFDQGAQRNWGTIVGTWGGADVSGLVGEIDNPNTGYAFLMNGFQQAAALVPLVKYDKRFARDVAKWTLNMANASRLFYAQYLPQTNQDDYTWSTTFDPQSVIAYEALKQKSLVGAIPLYATGDAKRNNWAQTNLGLYGSSHVGYLGALMEKTNVDGILLLDLNKTDFFGQNTFPSYLVYNPGSTTLVTLPLGANTYDIYDAISEMIIYTGASGNYSITAPGNAVLFLVYLPPGAATQARDGKLYLGTDVVDYHYGYDFNGVLRIRSLAAKSLLVEFNKLEKIYSSIENATGIATFNWFVNGTLAFSSPDSIFQWTVPPVAGQYNVVLHVTAGSSSAKDSLSFQVVQHIPAPPIVSGITADSTWYSTGKTATLICHAANPDGTKVQYAWTVPGGTILNQVDSLIRWSAPQNDGLFQASCLVTNHDALSASTNRSLLVKKKSQGTTAPLAYYPLDGDVNDYSGNARHGVLTGAQLTVDERGEPLKAYSFSSGAFIYVNNDAGLNFQNQITLAFWLKLNALTQESYVISHGSYEQRWKVSVLENGKMRWTVKTNTSTRDLDSSFPLQFNTFYHFTVVYTGYSMELYVNGVLDTFLADSGLIAASSKELTFGRKEIGISNYHLKGVLDEIRLYDKALAPNEIVILKSIWNTVTALAGKADQRIILYPNPSHGIINIRGLNQPVLAVSLLDATGRNIEVTHSYPESDDTLRIEFSAPPGLQIIKIQTATGVIFRKAVVF
ncbi:MAG: LamG-like jellyroll fold domain-containing protein [Cytophagales bacterium]|nr:LamG-like jellyroll fold domain-containing protein [Cytophagales bacterium]